MGLYLALSIILSALSFYLFREQYFVGILFILILMAAIWVKEKTFLKQLLKS